jgi:hypothetical protein
MSKLTPKQIGILAQYINELVINYADYDQEWEHKLASKINSNPDLPPYDSLQDECLVDILIDYYSDR